MSTQHTEGPWIEFSDQGETVAILPAGRGGHVAEFASPVTRANARLIAAAPDLLSALKGMLVFTANDFPNRAIAMAEAAIAKATAP